MKFLLLFSSLILLTQCQVKPILDVGEQLWPRPQNIAFGELDILISKVTLSTKSGSLVEQAFEIYEPLIHKHKDCISSFKNPDCVELKLNVICDAMCDEETYILNRKTPENYTLQIDANGDIILRASSYSAVIRGLETLAQLQIQGSLRGLPIQVQDWPAFSHRGLGVDTSRHFFSIDLLKNLIRGMQASKLNVFHWHITDSESFPLLLPSIPELALNSAYSKEQMYTVDDVKELIKYAKQRGIRIIPEIDMPGHTYSWAKSYPEIVSCWDRHNPGIPVGQLDPRKSKTFEIVKKVLNDVEKIFESDIIHVGFDEVFNWCYGVEEEEGILIREWFLGNVSEIISKEKMIMHYEDNYINYKILDKDQERVIYHSWHSLNYAIEILENTQSQIVLSSFGFGNHDILYLDCGVGNLITGGDQSWCDPYKSWYTFYQWKIPQNMTQYGNRVLGAEALQWSEQVDENNMELRVFPRVSALAEPLWTGKHDKKVPSARMNQHVNLLRTRDVKAQTLQPTFCETREFGRDGSCSFNQDRQQLY